MITFLYCLVDYYYHMERATDCAEKCTASIATGGLPKDYYHKPIIAQ